MTPQRELRSLIEEQLRPAAPADAAEVAADVARLAAVGLVEIARTPTGELTIAPRGREP